MHFPIVAGVVISALGVKEAMHHVGSADPFGLFGSAALLGGTSLYLAANTAFWRRARGTWSPWRLVGGTVLLAAIPVAAAIPALTALGAVVAITAAVITFELLRYRQFRDSIRKHGRTTEI